MEKESTRDIIEQYVRLKFPQEDTYKRWVNALCRPEIFEREEQLGKSFFQMNADELEDLFLSFRSTQYKNTGKDIPISPTYMQSLLSYYTDLFEFYIASGHLMQNVMRDQRFSKLPGRSTSDAPTITKTGIKQICARFESYFEPAEAAFLELLLWMFYTGFYENDEVINLKESDVDLHKKKAYVHGRTIQLCDECCEAMARNRKLTQYTSYRTKYVMVPYHGSYVYFPSPDRRKRREENAVPDGYGNLQEKSQLDLNKIINNRMHAIRNLTHVVVTARILYFRGFYDYIVSQCGEEHLAEILNSNRNIQHVRELDQYIEEYRCPVNERHTVKIELRRFVV